MKLIHIYSLFAILLDFYQFEMCVKSENTDVSTPA